MVVLDNCPVKPELSEVLQVFRKALSSLLAGDLCLSSIFVAQTQTDMDSI